MVWNGNKSLCFSKCRVEIDIFNASSYSRTKFHMWLRANDYQHDSERWNHWTLIIPDSKLAWKCLLVPERVTLWCRRGYWEYQKKLRNWLMWSMNSLLARLYYSFKVIVYKRCLHVFNPLSGWSSWTSSFTWIGFQELFISILIYLLFFQPL